MSEALLVSSGSGPGECQQAVAHFLGWLASEAELAGLELDVTERPGLHGPTSAVVVLTGLGASDFAGTVEGVILWRCQSSLRPRHLRKNWFIEVFRLPPSRCGVAIDPAAVEMQAIRAGGPGGQHQNKTSSAVRARWTDPLGVVWSVVVRDTRSQHQNRRLALDRLAVLVAADRDEAETRRKTTTRGLHKSLTRGSPRRVFDGLAFRLVD